MAFPIGVSLTPAPGGLQDYSNAFVFANGALVAQAASVSIQKRSNSQPRKTLHRGFAGLGQGAGTVEVTVESAVPSADFELIGGAHIDFWLKTGEPVEIGIVMGSRQTLLRGIVDEASYTHSTNEASKVSFHLVGRLEIFE